MLEVLARIRHRRTRSQLSPYIDGMLSDAESRRLEAHLAQCPACRDELAELRATVQSLSGLPLAEAPRSFALTAAPQKVEAPKPSRRLELGLGLATVAAALVLALVAFGDLLGVPNGDDEAASRHVAEIRTVPTQAGIFQGLATPEAPKNLQSPTEQDSGLEAAPTAPPAAMGPGEEATAAPPAPTVITPEIVAPDIAQPATVEATAAATATAAAAPPLETTPTPAEEPWLAETPALAAPSGPAVGGAPETPPAETPGAAAPTAPPEGSVALPTVTPPMAAFASGEPEESVTVEAYDQALAESQRQSQAAEEDGGPSRETVVRWLEIGLATGMALLFVSWVLARRWGRA